MGHELCNIVLTLVDFLGITRTFELLWPLESQIRRQQLIDKNLSLVKTKDKLYMIIQHKIHWRNYKFNDWNKKKIQETSSLWNRKGLKITGWFHKNQRIGCEPQNKNIHTKYICHYMLWFLTHRMVFPVTNNQ